MFTKNDIADIYPLSPMQESMLLHFLLHPESRSTYFEQRSYRITGSLDIGILQDAFNFLVERHASLRTIFVAKKSKRPLQIALKPRPVPWQQKDLSGMSANEQDHALNMVRSLDIEKGLDCTSELPIRITLVTLGESCFELIWSMHHIVVDGWSTGILYSELMEFYRSAVSGVRIQPPEVVPFSRYVTWLEKRDNNESLVYWQKELEGYQAKTVVPGELKHRNKNPYLAESVHLICDPGLGADLQEIATRWQVTLSTIIHTLWAVLLGWYNDSDDVVFGTVVSGRPESLYGSDRIVGLCINTIPVRMQFRKGMSIRQIAVDAQRRSLEASDHHFSDLAEIQNSTSAKRSLINHIVAVENFPKTFSENLDALTIQPTRSHEQINYDLALIVVPQETFEIELQYNRSAYDDATANNVARHVQTLLEDLVRNPEMLIEECEPLSTEEYSLLDSLNSTIRPFETDTTLSRLFERQVSAFPSGRAITDDKGSLTYLELAALSGRVAGFLRQQSNFSPGSCVAVMIDRSRWLPAALFGILQAGATYVPLDPLCPEQRAAAILKNCGCTIVLSLPDLYESLDWPSDILITDVTAIEEKYFLAESIPAPQGSPAYIFYTSGSTGTPKGVAISSASVINFASWIGHYYEFDNSTRSTMIASPAFDASILELIPVLLSGGSIYCLKDTFIDGEQLIVFYQKHDINMVYLPPVLCEEICKIHGGRLHPDFKILTGADVVRYVGDGSLRVFNNYGPTEGTVIATAVEVTGFDNEQPIPIGYPIDNTEIFIRDHHGRKTAPGAIGELFIGGAGVAQGYVGREDLTEERFIPHPLKEGDRVYRTGDRVRLAKKGGLDFLGRIDTQIQIRGFRIEPMEVEKSLCEHPMVRGAAVISRDEHGGEILVAFLIPESSQYEQRPPSKELRAFLRKVIPEYMIPTRFVWVEEFPLTVSSKIDRKKLRETVLLESVEDDHVHERQPVTPTEEQLCTIWREVIGVESISRDDNFFSLGGHSLSATRMASRVRQDLSIELSLRVIFDNPVLSDLALHIEELSNDSNDTVIEKTVA
ncbi:non-ribosomal peptide synthetase [Desulfosediminicola flagellatus]|uniref:non-ribosomal peptide synthetase n=1 Tax=Desulfosediminicola flagellatus TaxID=2569541 RepID=UPI0010AC4020|nr:non-ribosomal peptide synthetase [Desulfosediminicola flagellatus]